MWIGGQTTDEPVLTASIAFFWLTQYSGETTDDEQMDKEKSSLFPCTLSPIKAADQKANLNETMERGSRSNLEGHSHRVSFCDLEGASAT